MTLVGEMTSVEAMIPSMILPSTIRLLTIHHLTIPPLMILHLTILLLTIPPLMILRLTILLLMIPQLMIRLTTLQILMGVMVHPMSTPLMTAQTLVTSVEKMALAMSILSTTRPTPLMILVMSTQSTMAQGTSIPSMMVQIQKMQATLILRPLVLISARLMTSFTHWIYRWLY